MSRAYYNDTEEYVCNWLCNLMLEGLIPEGDVDQRSIRDVTPGDLRGYTQCHFFAGIGGWAFALRLAGWPDNEPVWTGSCPCQPFSVAGKQKGFDDARHLWPAFRDLIDKRRPVRVFGEQVAKAPEWLNLVRSDVEAMDYALGIVPIEAASAGADHFRDRYFFVADATNASEGWRGLQRPNQGGGAYVERAPSQFAGRGYSMLADDDDTERRPESAGRNFNSGQAAGWEQSNSNFRERSLSVLADDDDLRPQVALGQRSDVAAQFSPAPRDYFQHLVNRPQFGWGEGWSEHEFRSRGFTAAVANCDGSQFFECPDGKWRRLPPPRVRWLGNGVPARVSKLRAFGNAIDPRPASAFISSYMEIKGIAPCHS